MREQIQKPKQELRTIQSKTKASNQAPIAQILQTYKEKNIQHQAIDEDELLQGKFEMVQAVPSPLKQAEGEANLTGLPDNLKSGIENLSGYSMDDVRVHYNSFKPAQLQALAYTQGTNIHVTPGQEKHLPHEAWHVVQQKQGRVQPTLQLQGININDNEGLEKEADVMGEKAKYSNNEANKTIIQNTKQSTTWQFYREIGEDYYISENNSIALSKKNNKDLYLNAKTALEQLNTLNSLTEIKTRIQEPNRNGNVMFFLSSNCLIDSINYKKLEIDDISGFQVNRKKIFLNDLKNINSLDTKDKIEKLKEEIGDNETDKYIKRQFDGGENLVFPDGCKEFTEFVLGEQEKDNYKIVGLDEAELFKITPKKQKGAWPFHYGAILLRDGNDFITLENFAYDLFKNDVEWGFHIYGEQKGQSLEDVYTAEFESDIIIEYKRRMTTEEIQEKIKIIRKEIEKEKVEKLIRIKLIKAGIIGEIGSVIYTLIVKGVWEIISTGGYGLIGALIGGIIGNITGERKREIGALIGLLIGNWIGGDIWNILTGAILAVLYFYIMKK